ncbi:MAG TPA: SMC family ATPase, partial [Deinococcales bacterium]|nr:SMC family ATPase [Deinococcales bacterium]
RLVHIVGLDFPAFTRAILLPQGRFDEFLHGEARLRRSLLKELLDLNRLDRMREEAGRRERHEAARIGFLTERLETGGLEDAHRRLKELRGTLGEVTEQRTATARKLSAAEEALTAARQLSASHRELKEVQKELGSGAETAAREDALQNELRLGQSARLLLPQLTRLERLADRAEKTATETAAAESELGKLRSVHERDTRAAADAAERLATGEPLLTKRLAELRELLPLARRLGRLGGAPTGADGRAADWNEERFEELQALSGRSATLEDLTARSERTAAALAADEEKSARDRKRSAAVAEELARVVAAGQERADLLKRLASELEHARLHESSSVQELRAALHPGQDCPVCARPVQEPLPAPAAVTGEVARLTAEQEKVTAERQELLDRWTELREEAAGLEARLEAADRSRADRKAELGRLQGSLETELAAFTAAGFSGTAAEASAACRQALARQQAALAALIAERGGGSDPAAALEAAEAELETLRAEERRTAAAAAESGRRHEAAEENLGRLRSRQQELAAERDEAGRELAESLEAAGFETPEAVRAAVREPDRLAELEQLLEDLQQRLERLRTRERELQREIAGREDPGAGLAELASEVGRLEALAAQLQENEVSVRAAIRTAEDQVKEARELLTERRKREEERETWRVLAHDLQDNRFTDFLLAGLQRQLARHAGRIIRSVTDGRFDLHLSEQREFEVSDAWAGGSRRTVRSLSGGETFIVSLALALALSETAAGGRRLGALFLDEGFGTLDAATLDEVAGMLENLVADGRTVGLITHVTALSERLPDRLVVSRGPDGSSVSWED